ncbi:MAG: DUF4411 family protein [Chloroflexus sp.]|uniref:DUF4411 family protein n=1 Tax=Chloroflexus sp. TaxID=1904827 RepID=UPI0030A866E6
MKNQTHYLLDSDVFITAKNTYYAFDICPGFWDSLLYHHGNGTVFSIDRVRSELLAGSKTDDLVKWIRQKVPKSFFYSVENAQVSAEYEKIMLWVQRHQRYFDAAKAKFATGADGWLVAYARVHGFTVVTNETSAPESRNAIKLPDVCTSFGVQYQNTFDLLRGLGVRFYVQRTTQ